MKFQGVKHICWKNKNRNKAKKKEKKKKKQTVGDLV